MKNRLFALLLIVALVVTVSVFAVGAETPAVPTQLSSNLTVNGNTATGYCPHCDQENVTFTAWAGTDNLYTTGHYFIPANMAETAEYYIWVPENGETVLHLNGHVAQRKQGGIIQLTAANSKFYLLDSTQGGGELKSLGAWGATCGVINMGAANVQANIYSGKLAYTHVNGTKALHGGVFMVNAAGATVNMFGGTVTGTANFGGGAAYINNGGIFNMYGGTLRDCSVIKTNANVEVARPYDPANDVTNATKNPTAGKGGAVFVENGTFNMEGGLITGCEASFGGAIAVGSTTAPGIVRISGDAVIENCSANMYGGAIAVYGGKYWGTKEQNYALQNYDNKGRLEISGGTITGYARVAGGGIHIDNGATVTMTGGTLLNCTTTETVTNTDAGYPFTAADTNSHGRGGAVYAYGGTFTMSGGTIDGGRASHGGGIAVSSNASQGRAQVSGTAVIKNCYAKVYGGAIAVFKGKYWGTAAAGYPKLNYDRSGQLTVSGGDMQTNNTAGSLGGAIYVYNVPDDTWNDPVEISGGTIVGTSAGSAGAVYLGGGSVMNVSGGTITGTTPWDGGAFYLSSSTLNISGGTITGTGTGSSYTSGSSTVYFVGGGIAATSSSTITMTGGELKNCTTKGIGGAVHLANSTMTMTAGTISGSNNTAAMNALSGGAVYVASNSTFELDGGTIYQTTSTKAGAIYAEGAADKKANVVFKSGTIDGTKTVDNGGGILLMANSDLQMSGGTIQNTRNLWTGGGLVIYDASATATITGGTIKDCVIETDSAGAGMYVCANAAISVEGLTIQNCRTGKSSGGNLYIESHTANVTFNNCHFIGSGDAKVPQATYGGSVFVNNANVTFDSCEFTDGVAKDNGGNLYVNGSNANVTVTGNSTFSGGKAGSRGGNIGVYLGKLTLTGDTNVSGKDTSSVYMGTNVTVFGEGAALTLNGNVVIEDAPLHENANGDPYHQTWSVAIEPGCTVTVGGNVNVDDIVMRHTNDGAGTLMDGAMTIQSGFTGTIYVNLFYDIHMDGHEPGAEIGAWLAQDGYENTGIIGIYNEKWTKFFLVDTGDKFVVAPFTGIKNGVEYGLAAMPESGDYDYIKLYTGGDIPLTGDTTVRLNGQSANFINGTNKLTVIDTATNDCTTAGTSFTVSNPENLVRYAKNKSNGYQYVIVEKNGTFTSNRVQVTLDYLSIKPSQTGMYYTTTIKANVEATGVIKFYGTAVSLGENEITEDFLRDSAVMYTSFDAENNIKTDGNGNANMTTNSALVYGILTKDGEYNERNAGLKIKANSYICVNLGGGNDMYIMADESFEYSLNDAMEMLDGAVGEMTPSQQESAANFYKTWSTVFEDLGLSELEKLAA